MNSSDKFVEAAGAASEEKIADSSVHSLSSLLDHHQVAQARGKRLWFGALAALLVVGGTAAWVLKPGKAAEPTWVNETVREVRLNSTSLVAAGGEGKTLVAVAPGSLLQRQPSRSSPDEARLLEVYGLLASGDSEEALQKAQRLATDAPNFALAQLLYADLLTAQIQQAGVSTSASGASSVASVASSVSSASTAGVDPTANAQRATGFGAASTELVAAGRERLDELTDEARVRVQAAAVAPAAGLVPSALVSLAPTVKHAVAVDVARSRVYVFENGSQGLSLIREYYASIGKNGMLKQVAGDQRTPLGVYFVTKQIPSATLPAKYGKQALALNYPNPYDRLQGRSGDGIWLHGIPAGMYSRAPWATDGCIALANHYLQELSAYIDVQATPIVVAERLEWVKPADLTNRHAAFLGQFAKWQAVNKQNSPEARDGFYSTSVNLPEAEALGPPWRDQLREEQQRRVRRGTAAEAAANAAATLTAPADLSILSWQDRDEVMVVTFTELEPGDKRPRTRRQYWIQEPVGWRIFYERALG